MSGKHFKPSARIVSDYYRTATVRRQILAPQRNGDCDHEITIQITIPIYGQRGGREDLVTAARIMGNVRNSVHSQAVGELVENRSTNIIPELVYLPIPTLDQVIGKDDVA